MGLLKLLFNMSLTRRLRQLRHSLDLKQESRLCDQDVIKEITLVHAHRGADPLDSDGSVVLLGSLVGQSRLTCVSLRAELFVKNAMLRKTDGSLKTKQQQKRKVRVTLM